jgi:hypothetical protein
MNCAVAFDILSGDPLYLTEPAVSSRVCRRVLNIQALGSLVRIALVMWMLLLLSMDPRPHI